ncbi:MAG: hypothetical protein GY906_28355 [bacterium]|nr:hypothetical protein [bacterium]
MKQRTLQEIKRDLRNTLDQLGTCYEMKYTEGIEHYKREVEALERELELRLTGRVLTCV